jgi:hypothetical protein
MRDRISRFSSTYIRLGSLVFLESLLVTDNMLKALVSVWLEQKQNLRRLKDDHINSSAATKH